MAHFPRKHKKTGVSKNSWSLAKIASNFTGSVMFLILFPVFLWNVMKTANKPADKVVLDDSWLDDEGGRSPALEKRLKRPSAPELAP